jgi:hypothetical protein
MILLRISPVLQVAVLTVIAVASAVSADESLAGRAVAPQRFSSCVAAKAHFANDCFAGISAAGKGCSNWKAYNIATLDGSFVPTYCQYANGAVWTLVGTVSGADAAWTYSEQSNANHNSPWEDGSTFGALNNTASYKNRLWNELGSSEIMITEGGPPGGVQPVAVPVLRTVDNCLRGKNLDSFFGSLA